MSQQSYTVKEGDTVKFSNGLQAHIRSLGLNEFEEPIANVIWEGGAAGGDGPCSEHLDEIETWFDPKERPSAELVEGSFKL